MEGAAKPWTAELSTAITEELKVQVAERGPDLEDRCMTIARKLERLVTEKCAYAEKELDEQLRGKSLEAQKKVKDLLTKIGTETGRKPVVLVKGKNGEAKVNFEELFKEKYADEGNLKLEKLLKEFRSPEASKPAVPAGRSFTMWSIIEKGTEIAGKFTKQASKLLAERSFVMEGAAKPWTAELSTAITEELKVQVAEKGADLKLKRQLEERCMTIARKLERLVTEECAYSEKELNEQLRGKSLEAQKDVKDLLTTIGTEIGRKLVGLVTGKNGEAKVNLEELLVKIDADEGNLKLEKLLKEIGAEIASKFKRKAGTFRYKARNFQASTNKWIFGNISIIVIVLAVLVAIRGHSTNGERYREDFEAKVAMLQHQFRNQNQVLWNALQRLGSEHIVEYFNRSSSEPSRPLVFVLVSTPDNSEELNCFSEGVATAFLNKRDYGVLDGSNITRRSQSKPDVDEDIERRLTSSSTYPVLLVKDLGSLPYDVASLFFKYCDNEDAPYPHAIFIFTLLIDGNNSVLSSSTRKEITSKSYEYLTTVAWKDAEKAKTDALIARIVNPYPLSVMKEDSSMLKEVC